MGGQRRRKQPGLRVLHHLRREPKRPWGAQPSREKPRLARQCIPALENRVRVQPNERSHEALLLLRVLPQGLDLVVT